MCNYNNTKIPKYERIKPKTSYSSNKAKDQKD